MMCIYNKADIILLLKVLERGYAPVSSDLITVPKPILNKVLYSFKINRKPCSQTNYNLFLYELSRILFSFLGSLPRQFRKFQFGITNGVLKTISMSYSRHF